MKHLIMLSLIAISFTTFSQTSEKRKLDNYQRKLAFDKIRKPVTYNPYAHQLLDGSIAFDAAGQFYDEVNFVYRPYSSKEEFFKYIGDTNLLKDGLQVFIKEGGIIRIYVWKHGALQSNKITHGR